MSSQLGIGIDIGGTKISIVAGDAFGRIFESRVIPTLTGSKTKQGIAHLLAELKDMTADARFKNRIAGIGIGIPGPVNSKNGTVPFSPNLPGWKNLALKKMIQSKLRIPVVMANDANAAALGEKVFGQGRNVSDFIYMTVSTGIGGGVVIGGKLLEGVSFVAGEIGHMKIVPRGNPCKCGMKGCLESYASGTAIAASAKKMLTPAQIKKVLSFSDASVLSAKVLGRAARRGYAPVIRVYRHAAFYLGVGIANLLNALNPEKVILGGGVFKSAPPEFWNAMLQSCAENAWPEAFQAVKIVPSKLHGRVGDLGALALVFTGLESSSKA